tara:strand:+ start:33 stop:509 length:477 start_codon:yes stop_codon:yes gene_type:complete
MSAFGQAWDLVKAPTVYHGGKEWEGEPRHPLFFTENREGAEWYARERGGDTPTLQTADLTSFKKPANIDDIIESSRGMVDSYVDKKYGNEIWDEITQHSPYDGTNPLDLLYIPRIRDALREKGFDGVSINDVLSNTEIPTHIPLNHSQYKIKQSERLE